MKSFFIINFFILLASNCFSQDLNLSLTPGKKCVSSQSDFKSFFSIPPIAMCEDSIDLKIKALVAFRYGIKRYQWDDFYFNRLIPLCLGGSNEVDNIWPIPIKNISNIKKYENEICLKFSQKKISQDEAILEIKKCLQLSHLKTGSTSFSCH